jgi:Ni/Fe-hydrogenase subunit HybB-like protein
MSVLEQVSQTTFLAGPSLLLQLIASLTLIASVQLFNFQKTEFLFPTKMMAEVMGPIGAVPMIHMDVGRCPSVSLNKAGLLKYGRTISIMIMRFMSYVIRVLTKVPQHRMPSM